MASPTQNVRCPRCGTLNRVTAVASGAPRCGKCHTALPWLVDAEPSAFDATIDATVPVLVDFWAEWCGPCRMVSPAVEAMGREFAGRLKIVKLDIDAAPAIAARYDVQGIPLLMLFRHGQEIDRIVGAVPPARLRAWLEPYLAPATDEAHAGG